MPIFIFGQALTYIPDNNFEQALIELGFDEDVDNYVLTENINSIIELDVNSMNITNLTGIEDFNLLENLICYNNQLSEINVSENIYLKYLNCSDNLITNINLNENIFLENLNCSNNQITEINLNQNEELKQLLCHYNELPSLNISSNTELQTLECQGNLITDLNVSSAPSLETLYCGGNLLTSLDVSNNVQLLYLGFVLNEISEINLSSNVNLINLNCHNNVLINLNISNNSNLINLDAHNNNINCIQVENIAYAESSELSENWIKDEFTIWSLDCQTCSEDIEACNYSPDGTQSCIYPIDLYGISYLDCDGSCLNDTDGDGVCNENDNCIYTYNPNQEDFDVDGIGDACDGIGLEEDIFLRKLTKVIDLMGRDVSKEHKDVLLLYIYDDGSVEKSM